MNIKQHAYRVRRFLESRGVLRESKRTREAREYWEAKEAEDAEEEKQYFERLQREELRRRQELESFKQEGMSSLGDAIKEVAK